MCIRDRSSTTEFVPCGENVLKYTKDGASYLDKSGKAVWSMSYELKSPICYVNGDYAVIGDQQGNDIYIVDKTGSQGQATTLLPILRASVSAVSYTHLGYGKRWFCPSCFMGRGLPELYRRKLCDALHHHCETRFRTEGGTV